MATKRADELVKGDWIVLWAGPVGTTEAQVTGVETDGTGFLLVELDELEWAELRVAAAEEVDLAD